MAAVTGLNHLTLATADLPRAIAFYRGLLGMRLAADWANGAYLEAGALWLCLTRQDAPVTPSADYTHYAFHCAPADFDTLRTAIAAKAPLWRDNRSEGRSLYFLDPDGHRLELHQGSLASRLDHYRKTRPPGMALHG